MLQTRARNLYYLWLIISLSAIFFLIFFYTQQPLTYTFSRLFDGNEYLKACLYFRGAVDTYKVSFPYHSRIMMPFLVSHIPLDAISGFNLINAIFMLGGIIVIFKCWQKLGFPVFLIIAGLIWLLIHWVGIIRYNLYDPISVDVPLYLFGMIFLFAVIKNKPWLMLIIAAVSTLNKESIIPILAVLVIYYIVQWIRKEESGNTPLIFIGALGLVIIIKLILDHNFPPLQPGRGSIRTLLFHSKETLQHPFRIIHWIAGFVVAFGPWLALYFLSKIKKAAFEDTEELLLALMAISSLAISFLGGNDFTRLIFLGFPFIMTWFLYNLKELPPRLIFISLFLGLPFTRIFELIPDPGKYGWQPFYKWHPEFTSPLICCLWIGYFLVMGIVIFILKRRPEINPKENSIG